jgi:dUTP pyrophosphatase
MNQYILYVNPCNNTTREFYKDHPTFHSGDCGFDLFFPEDITFKLYETKIVDLQIKCEMIKNIQSNKNVNVSYYLYARSSISKTPLVLCNSVGIIDAGYRGNIKVALKYLPDINFDDKNQYFNETFTVKKGERLVQICTPTLDPLHHEIVDNLSQTSRGDGGFGSTGK